MSDTGKFIISVIVPLIIILTVFIPQQLKKQNKVYKKDKKDKKDK